MKTAFPTHLLYCLFVSAGQKQFHWIKTAFFDHLPYYVFVSAFGRFRASDNESKSHKGITQVKAPFFVVVFDLRTDLLSLL